MTLNSILNVVMPIIIFGAVFIFIYIKGKKHFDRFFAWVKEKIQSSRERVSDVEIPIGSEIYYR